MERRKIIFLRYLLFTALLLCNFIFVSKVKAAWFNGDWSNRIKMTIDADKVNGDLSNFPVYLDLSNLDDSFFSNNLNIDLYMSNLKETRKYDKTYGGSKIGPHKSDFIFYTKDNFLVSQLSTGQQKTIVLLLIFAQIQYLINEENQKPIVLFDEICSHLDELNRSILQRITLENDIQFFMTGTSKTLFSFLSTNTNFYNITEK